jgi:hypothetical protein
VVMVVYNTHTIYIARLDAMHPHMLTPYTNGSSLMARNRERDRQPRLWIPFTSRSAQISAPILSRAMLLLSLVPFKEMLYVRSLQ